MLQVVRNRLMMSHSSLLRGKCLTLPYLVVAQGAAGAFQRMVDAPVETCMCFCCKLTLLAGGRAYLLWRQRLFTAWSKLDVH